MKVVKALQVQGEPEQPHCTVIVILSSPERQRDKLNTGIELNKLDGKSAPGK